MPMLKKFLPVWITGIFFFFCSRGQAQTREEFSGWTALFGSYKFNSKFGLHFEGQFRSTSGWEQIQTYILRFGINYYVKPNMMGTLGYAYIGHYRTIMDVSGWGPEQRIWEQFLLNKSFSFGGHASSIVNRFRLEQRFISQSSVANDELVTDRYNFMQRFRYFVRWIVPIQKTDKFQTGPYTSLQDEVFFNVQHADVTTGHFFDQNRAYISFGYRIAPSADIEIGYLNQFILGRNNNVSNNIIQFATYLRL